jgi:hypothetical protein
VAAVSAVMGPIMVAAIVVTVPRASAAHVPWDDAGSGALAVEGAVGEPGTLAPEGDGVAQRAGATSLERVRRQPAEDSVTLDATTPAEQGDGVVGRQLDREADETSARQAPEPEAVDQPTPSQRQRHAGERRSVAEGPEASEQEAVLAPAPVDPAARHAVALEQREARGRKDGRPLQPAQPEASLSRAGLGGSTTGKKSGRHQDGQEAALTEPLAPGGAGGTAGEPGTPEALALSREEQALPQQGPFTDPGTSALLLTGASAFLTYATFMGCGELPAALCAAGAVGTGVLALRKDFERIQLAEQRDGTQSGPHRAAMIERILAEWLGAFALGGIGKSKGPFWMLFGSMAGPWVGTFLAGNWGPSNQRLHELTTPAVPQAPVP